MRSFYRHFRKGDVYELLHDGARLESLGLDGDGWVVYRSVATGQVWIRPHAEFYGKAPVDGGEVDRFVLDPSITAEATTVAGKVPAELALFDELRQDSRATFLEKNRAYGGAYRLFGTLGVIVRLGDKLLRAFNLIMTGAKHNDEALADTLKDLENYATIARITERQGNVRGLFW